MKKVFQLFALMFICLRCFAEENKFGVMTNLSCGSFDIRGGARHVEAASRLCGDWGWVRQWVSAATEEAKAHAQFILLCRACRLKPILYLGDLGPVWTQEIDEMHRPKADSNGSFTGAAHQVAVWVQAVQSHGVGVPFLEVWNEPNLAGEWGGAPNPQEYGRFLVQVVKAVRAVSPRTRFLNGGLSPSNGTDDNEDKEVGRLGDENLDNLYFIDAMLAAVPEATACIDYWSSHSYPFNHPPDYNESRYGVRGYRWELERLAAAGIRRRAIITETGYPVGDRTDRTFRMITEEERIAWTVRAFMEVWLPDPDVVAVCPFLLGDPVWGHHRKWQNVEWTRPDGTPRGIYETIAALPREVGSDYLPSGTCGISGTVRMANRGPAVRALVWLSPDGYASLTDDQGQFRIEGVPGGRYRLQMQASGCPTQSDEIVIQDGMRGLSTELPYVGLLPNSGMKKRWRVLSADGKTEDATPPVDAFFLDDQAAPRNPPSLGIRASGCVFEDTDYLSITGESTYRLRAWYRCAPVPDNATAELNARVSVRIEPLNAEGPNPLDSPVEAAAVIAQNPGWQALELLYRPTSVWTQRVRVILAAEAPGGTVWFDDVLLEPI